ncbi:MAG: hypothetical protein QNK23_14105 [Crocinitomicaceae bacterium]|nr:hypothetical protein [Crocinitomicaceae bacterium]
MNTLATTLVIGFLFLSFNGNTQNETVAREWNNLVLEAIRNDFARPTVHARNLFHHSIITYDAWAAYAPSKSKYFLGDTLNGYICVFDGVDIPLDVQSAREEAISFASYRFIQNRYSTSPDYVSTYNLIYSYMIQKGYDVSNISTDYINDGPAALGNYLAEQIQLYGYTDGSNELGAYNNLFYDQVNPPIIMSQPGNPDIQDPNRWQPITLAIAIDQSGNPVLSTPGNLSPEWGEVHPFSLDTSMYTELTRDGDTYKVYFDTMMPTYLNLTDSASWDSFYKWNHTLVSVWQSHLDPSDGVNWDISPGSLGNNTWYPENDSQYPAFYDLINGGDPSTGYALNPVTGLPYAPNVVPRGDYARVLAEFWADGLDSETPPGHWFEIYHYVTDQPSFERKWQGTGPILDSLEFDVKSHLTLGGTMHDAAICAWSLKGYYDYIRPVSAIRYMADQGQSSDTLALNFDPNGIPLLAGYVELVQIGDSLAGTWNENVGKIKLYTWKGHEYITDPLVDVAGVDWILAENWWPYQRPTFVTPPFSGFVSGHSTFSRAASKTMEYITGSPYFPEGLGEFHADQNEYLQFEDGPSVDITLQWASYKDAADQCSLSRLWGGIHPPIDDIPGRRIGEVVGEIAFDLADSIFTIDNPALIASSISDNLINVADIAGQFSMDFTFNVGMDTTISPTVNLLPVSLSTAVGVNQVSWIDSFNVQVLFDVLISAVEIENTKVELSNLITGNSQALMDYTFSDYFIVDTKLPVVESIATNYTMINDAVIGQDFILDIEFNEACDQNTTPVISFSGPTYLNSTLVFNAGMSSWLNDSVYAAYYTTTDFDEDVNPINIDISMVDDAHFNTMAAETQIASFTIDTKNPAFSSMVSSELVISQEDLLTPTFIITADFDQAMNTGIIPAVEFQNQGISFDSIIQNVLQTMWIDTNTLTTEFVVYPSTNDLTNLDILMSYVQDENGNSMIDSSSANVVVSDMLSPQVTSIARSHSVISDSVIGTSVYYLDVQFTEPMDTTVKPLVTHLAAQSLTGTIQYNVPASTYLDSTTFRAYYQVIDENIEIDPVHVQVDFGKDFVGNNQVLQTDSNFATIDTKNPSVLGVYSNSYLLNQMGEPFNVVALFDEDMNTTIDAVLTFDPMINTPTQLTMIDSFWVNSITFEFNYELQGSPTQTEVFGITIESAIDEAGNLLIPSNNLDYLTIEEVLGMIELEEGRVLLYPTLLNSGHPLHIVGLDDQTNEEISFKLINLMGQVEQELLFQKSGGIYTSSPIDLKPGMYFLRNENISFNIIISE